MTEQMMPLVLQLGTIILCAYAGGRIARRLGLPSCWGELTAGMIVGPYLLGGIALPAFPHGLFSDERRISDLHRTLWHDDRGFDSAPVSGGYRDRSESFPSLLGNGPGSRHGRSLVSFFLGNVCTVLFFELVLDQEMHFFSAIPLFMGVISSATSVGIFGPHSLGERPGGFSRRRDDPFRRGHRRHPGGDSSFDRRGDFPIGKVEWLHCGNHCVGRDFDLAGSDNSRLLLVRWLGRFFNRIRDVAMFSILCLGVALVMAGLFEKAGPGND
jgi:hypothetical protein